MSILKQLIDSEATDDQIKSTLSNYFAPGDPTDDLLTPQEIENIALKAELEGLRSQLASSKQLLPAQGREAWTGKSNPLRKEMKSWKYGQVYNYFKKCLENDARFERPDSSWCAKVEAFSRKYMEGKFQGEMDAWEERNGRMLPGRDKRQRKGYVANYIKENY